MSAYIEGLIAFGSAHPHVVGLVAFLAAFFESVAVVGAIVPGSVLLVGLGALVPAGAADLWILLAWAIAGATAGDSLSYWLGRLYGDAIRQWRPFRRNPQLIAWGESFLSRHGGMSVFLARFVQGPRSIVPLVAGMFETAPRRFYPANILSALLWAPAHILPGVVFGAALDVAAAVSLRLLALIGIFVFAAVATVWGVRALVRHGIPRLAAALDALMHWAGRGAGDSRPRRWLYLLLHSVRTEVPAVTVLGMVCVLALWGFLGVLEDVITGDPLVQVDTAVFNLLQELRSPWADRVMVGVTELGDGVVVTAVSFAVLTWLAWRRAWRPAAYWLAGIGLAAVFSKGLKAALHLPRPTPGLYQGWSAFTFPSGHATTNAVLYGLLALLVWPRLGRRGRFAVSIGAAVLITAIALSRLYLGAHWLADVLGGLSFAAAWVALLGAFYFRRSSPRVGALGPLTVAGVTLATAGGLNLAHHYTADLSRYATHQEPHVMTAAEWRTGGWHTLPAARSDLGGEVEEPLILQWAGDLANLRQQLSRAGWQAPRPWSLRNALGWLTTPPDPAHLPVVPTLNDGRPPELTLIRPTAGDGARPSRLVLRMWPSGIVVRDAVGEPHPLWMGGVVRERFRSLLSLLTIAETRPEGARSVTILADSLPFRRVVRRETPSADADWHGRVLLARATPPAP